LYTYVYMKKTATVIIGVVLILAAGLYVFRAEIEKLFLRPTESSLEEGITETSSSREVTIIAENLSVPWEVVLLDEEDYLITERPGTLKRIGSNGQVFEIEGVEETSEGGLLGLALHPDFSENNYIYLYATTRKNGELKNQISRYSYADDQLSEPTRILDDIPASAIHDGGRIAFGPDGLLYATTGDAGLPELAQDTASLAGKILRMTDQGEIPNDNPFDNYTYSYGHRNPQGLAWDDEERLWSSEHGPSGAESGNDEINLIEKGANYGWPVIRGQETSPDMKTPIAESGTEETWAPAGLAYSQGSLFFTGLRGQTLYEAVIDGENLSLKAHLKEEYGRLRAVVADDDFLLVTTSNTDGRGDPRTGDDKVLKFPRGIF